jgi:hypothetical protein
MLFQSDHHSTATTESIQDSVVIIPTEHHSNETNNQAGEMDTATTMSDVNNYSCFWKLALMNDTNTTGTSLSFLCCQNTQQ